MYIELIPLGVQLKLTQYCKAIMLQRENKIIKNKKNFLRTLVLQKTHNEKKPRHREIFQYIQLETNTEHIQTRACIHTAPKTQTFLKRQDK